LDIHAAASNFIKWNAAYDNTYNYNSLGALPDGLGLTAAIDGSASLITATVTGVWAFVAQARLAADVTAEVTLNWSAWGLQVAYSPRGVPTGGYQLHTAEVVALPSGAAGSLALTTTAAATANPYTATELFVNILRLA
jgi:hypothetical protein